MVKTQKEVKENKEKNFIKHLSFLLCFYVLENYGF
jgi:hypothetical protein